MQAREFVATKGLSQYFRERVYVQRKAIAVRKDLAEARFTADLFERGDVRFIEVTPENSFERHGGYVDESRKLKALYYLEQGYRGYALVRGRNIIGDIWYFAPDQAAVRVSILICAGWESNWGRARFMNSTSISRRMKEGRFIRRFAEQRRVFAMPERIFYCFCLLLGR
jgi:hypothetical protein